MTARTQAVHWDLHYDIHLGATWSRFMEGLQNQTILAARAGCHHKQNERDNDRAHGRNGQFLYAGNVH